jgi:hypothetical protein
VQRKVGQCRRAQGVEGERGVGGGSRDGGSRGGVLGGAENPFFAWGARRIVYSSAGGTSVSRCRCWRESLQHVGVGQPFRVGGLVVRVWGLGVKGQKSGVRDWGLGIRDFLSILIAGNLLGFRG